MSQAKAKSDVSVLVIGAGGLGAPALLALVDAGVRRIGIVDSDRVEMSNLHRQILYRESDLGCPKAEVAKQRLQERVKDCVVEALVQKFTLNCAEIVEDYDLVLDGTDRFETKILISDICSDRDRPYVFAGVVGTDGQVMAVNPGESACLRCLFDEAPSPEANMSCEEQGVIGPIAGVVAAEQVRRALLAYDGDKSILNQLWSYDGRSAVVRCIGLARMADCKGCGARKYLRGQLNTSMSVIDDTGSELVEILSLVNTVCPHTYTETKRALDKLGAGEKLWVHLSSDESARNVPVSALAAGYELLAQHFDGETHRLLFAQGSEGIVK